MNPANHAGRMLEADLTIEDPGDGGVLACTKQGGHVDLVTGGAETRTVAAPTKSGLEMSLSLKTDGGDCVVTLAAAGNQTGNNTITFGDVGDLVKLRSYDHGGTHRWKIVANDGATLSTV